MQAYCVKCRAKSQGYTQAQITLQLLAFQLIIILCGKLDSMVQV